MTFKTFWEGFKKRSLFRGFCRCIFISLFEMTLKQFWTIKYSKTVKYFDDLKQFTAFKVANMLESGGVWISPHLLDHLKTQWKTKNFFFDFLKVHNESGKVMKFGTSRTLFSWRNGRLKIVQADSAPPAPIGLNCTSTKSQIWLTL